MDSTILIMTGVLIITLAAPFLVSYAIRFAKAGNYTAHKKIQNITFIICVLGVLVLEGLIRYSGGSGSLSGQSDHSGTSLFSTILIAHIIGAVLTYILWIYLILVSNNKFKKSLLPGSFSVHHKKLGIILFIGLVYTAVTALIVYLMTLNII